MTETARLRLPEIAAAQAQKHVTHNEALVYLDTLVQASVKDKDLTAPPVSPGEGDCYIVAGGGGTATGAWASWEKRIVRFQDGQWISFLPGVGDGAGWLVWVQDEDNMYRFDGTDWALAGIAGPPGADGSSGPQGQGIEPDATGTLTERDAYDGAAQGFVYLRTDVTPFELYVKASASSGDWAGPSPLSGGGTGGSPGVCDFRLTLESGVPVSTSDQTAKTTLYATPYCGDKIGLYDGSAWNVLSSAEISISFSGLTANTNYDVFCYDNAGTPALELLAWSSDTARATALARQDGILVKSGALTRRYLGTIRTTGTTGQCEDSAAKRFVWNMHHRKPRAVSALENGVSWTYSTASWRQMNNSIANQIAFVRGQDEDAMQVFLRVLVDSSVANTAVEWGIGLDSVTTPIVNNYAKVSTSTDNQRVTNDDKYVGPPGLGYHYLAAMEYGAGHDTQTWYGNGAGVFTNQIGLKGELFS